MGHFAEIKQVFSVELQASGDSEWPGQHLRRRPAWGRSDSEDLSNGLGTGTAGSHPRGTRGGWASVGSARKTFVLSDEYRCGEFLCKRNQDRCVDTFAYLWPVYNQAVFPLRDIASSQPLHSSSPKAQVCSQ